MDFLRLDFLLDESRGACCGEVSPELAEDGPALDMSAAVAAALLPGLRSPTGVAAVSGAALMPPRALLVFRLGCAWGDVGSAAALRLRVGGWRIGGEPGSVAVLVVEGEAWVIGLAVLSAESLAAEERVTLCDMGKSVFGSKLDVTQ